MKMSDAESQASPDLVELGFMDARSKVIDVAAFLDRVQRAGQDEDYRVKELKKTFSCLEGETPDRAKNVLLSLSDPTEDPVPKAPCQGAVGAWDGKSSS